ncbi:uncharacterized protein BcabD6B2_11440 [Babesia caballi]|uniref:Uncharacterized protein n=1 Tax=Babesia caballi TaxID=5871 RepID=A0AAV4LSW7_BABCB|nr:hypothetical protein, conserved [Babesia caballi]
MLHDCAEIEQGGEDVDCEDGGDNSQVDVRNHPLRCYGVSSPVRQCSCYDSQEYAYKVDQRAGPVKAVDSSGGGRSRRGRRGARANVPFEEQGKRTHDNNTNTKMYHEGVHDVETPKLFVPVQEHKKVERHNQSR